MRVRVGGVGVDISTVTALAGGEVGAGGPGVVGAGGKVGAAGEVGEGGGLGAGGEAGAGGEVGAGGGESGMRAGPPVGTPDSLWGGILRAVLTSPGGGISSLSQ